MKNRSLAILFAFIILMAGSGIGAAASYIVHNDESIQAAVDNAENGSVIILKPGTYNQNVTIDGSDLTIMSSTGNPDDVIIQGKDEYVGSTFIMEYESGVTFKGITIKGIGDYSYAIYGGDAYGVTVENCKIINQDCGVVSGMVGTINIINTTFINCKSGIGVGEFAFIQGHDNTFIDCGEILARAEEDMATVELINSKIINTKDQPPKPPADNKTNNTKPTDPVPTPTETPVEETGGSSGGSSHHSSSSSGSGGGGTGGSPEPQKNVAAKDTAKVFVPNGKQVTFNFVNGVTTVNSISFTSKKTMGKITAITEDLKSKSSLVKDLPEGKIYKSFNVWVGNAGYGDSNNIQNATVDFKVEKSWLQENDINKSSIVLYKYDSENKEWIELIPAITDEDDKFVYFTAKVPGYSSFVIAGKDASTTQPTEETVNESAGGEIRSTGNGTVTKGTEKESPGFGLISGVVGLLGVFLYKGKRV